MRMKGTIRLLVGVLLVMGGVGGIETNTEVAIPLDSLGIAILGLFLAGWGAIVMNKEEGYE